MDEPASGTTAERPNGRQAGVPCGCAEGVAEGLSLIAQAEDEGAGTFQLLDREWEVHEGVFSPAYTYGTEFYSLSLPFPVGGRFLEVGCGAGVTAVEAALAGCREVCAVDLTPQAVANTRRNAELHQARAVRAGVSDVFGGVERGSGFDVVFWNIPYVSVSADYAHASPLSHAVFDIEHRLCHAYVGGVRPFLARGGTAYIGLGDIGDQAALERIATAYGWAVRLVASASGEPDPHIEHRLYALVDTTA
jgi:release factor glutamine methyltransferase